jgi:hypothetical protein
LTKGGRLNAIIYLSDESDAEEYSGSLPTCTAEDSLALWTYKSQTSAPARVALELELENGTSSTGPEHTLALSSLRLLVARTMDSQCEDWYNPTEQNPLHLFRSEAMLHIDVLERVFHYLHAHSLLVRGLKQHALVISPSIYQLSFRLQHVPKGSFRGAVWKHDALPTYVIVPVVVDEQLDPRNPSSGRRMHWYTWFGPVVEVDGAHEVRFYHLDSLPTPAHTEMAERRRRLGAVMTATMPELKVDSHRVDPALENYRQDPGSLDCGVFVAQAVSALLFEDPSALKTPLPAVVVRSRIERILSACKSGVLPRLAEGYRPEVVTLLHQPGLPSADGFYSVQSFAPAPQLSTSSDRTATRPAPWHKRATEEYRSKLLIGAIPPLPRALSAETFRSSSPPHGGFDTARRPSSPGGGSLPTASPRSQRGASGLSSSRVGPRTKPPARSMSVESGMSYVRRRRAPYAFAPVDGGIYEPFFRELKEEMCTWGVGRLQAVREREVGQVLIGAFMQDGPTPRRLPAGISVVEGGTHGRPADQGNAMGVREFITAVRNIEDLAERDRAILTGVHRGEVLNLDWRKDSLDIEEDWLEIAMDIDSLSLTVEDPQFTASVALQLYPARATTLTCDNRLRVDVDGVETPFSHSTCLTSLQWDMT